MRHAYYNSNFATMELEVCSWTITIMEANLAQNIQALTIALLTIDEATTIYLEAQLATAGVVNRLGERFQV